MTPERWQEIKGVFSRAIALEPEERVAFLAEFCAGDGELREQVEALIRDHERAGSFIETPVAGAAAEAWPPAAPWEGRSLGAYRIVREIDHGGMGTVYLGERADEQFRQRVAIKVIRRGMASDYVLARFRQERQILANLDHPGIARLLDGGSTQEGQPYLVMEYIEGERIDRYCDRLELSLEERLRLFRKVCAAVQYAHQNLVIHRDLKPSNILVTAEGEPKLLDFGTAKLLAPSTAELGALPTATGMWLMTPEYASPEQLRGGTVTTVSDVYALGVVLYELLSGRRPYRFEDRHSPEAIRIVCEQEVEPPSTALRRRAEAPRRPASARLAKRLAGDLDNVVLMAVRKDPQRRYGSVEQLSEDLGRHLDGLPVIARRDTVTYRLAKFLRRHRVGAAAAAAATLAVLAGAGTAVWKANEALEAQAALEVSLQEAETMLETLGDLLGFASPGEIDRETNALELLEMWERNVRAGFGDTQPALLASLLDKFGNTYRQWAMFEEARGRLEEAARIRRERLGPDAPSLVDSWTQLGRLALDEGRLEESRRLLERAEARHLELSGRPDLKLAAIHNYLGAVLFASGDYAEALRLHEQVMDLRLELGASKAQLTETRSNIATALYGLSSPEDLAEAEDLLWQVLADYEELHGSRHRLYADALVNLAAVLVVRDPESEEGRRLLEQAAELNREIYQGDHPALALNLSNLGAAWQVLGEPERANDLYGRALSLFEKKLDPDHPAVATTLYVRALLSVGTRESEAVLADLRRALAIRERRLGEADSKSLEVRADLGFSLWAEPGKEEEAERVLGRLLELQLGTGVEALEIATTRVALGEVLVRLSRAEEAEPLLREALGVRSELLTSEDRDVAMAEGALGECLGALGRYEEAERRLRRSLEALRAAAEPDPRDIGLAEARLEALLRRAAEAREGPG